MAEPLFVILGAGASSDCATGAFVRHPGWQPPLVKDLFNHARYGDVLHRYPLAQMIAADLEGAPAESLVLEQHLRTRYRDSPHAHERLKYAAAPLYLQELLWSCSRLYAHSPDNLDRILTSLLTLPEVVFVSLNYDTLLDDRLWAISRPSTLEEYVGVEGRNWSLIKLHGSVDWATAVGEGYDGADVTLPLTLAETIVLRRGASIDELRFTDPPTGGRAQYGSVYFPALSVPIGSVDELVCPPAHVKWLQRK